jgi:hypothetical protein
MNLCGVPGAFPPVILREPFAPVILRSEATKDIVQGKLRERRISGDRVWRPFAIAQGDIEFT